MFAVMKDTRSAQIKTGLKSRGRYSALARVTVGTASTAQRTEQSPQNTWVLRVRPLC